MFVALAMMAGWPTMIKAGKVKSVPPPATALIGAAQHGRAEQNQEVIPSHAGNSTARLTIS